MSTVPIIEERVKCAVESRSILPENIVPPPGFKPLQVNMMSAHMYQLSYDPRFHKWCSDLYLYYWKKAKPITIS